MPTPTIKSYATQTGKSINTIERFWEEAKKQALKKFKGKKDAHFWAYVNAITKRRSGIQETTSFKEFVSSLMEEDK